MKAAGERHGLTAQSKGGVTLIERHSDVWISTDTYDGCSLDADRARHLARALNRLAKRIDARAEPVPERQAA